MPTDEPTNEELATLAYELHMEHGFCPDEAEGFGCDTCDIHRERMIPGFQ